MKQRLVRITGKYPQDIKSLTKPPLRLMIYSSTLFFGVCQQGLLKLISIPHLKLRVTSEECGHFCPGFEGARGPLR